MKKIKFILYIFIFFCVFSYNNECRAQEITYFEGIGRYSVAIAGNNNAYRGPEYNSGGEELILDYPDNWDSIKNNIPGSILSRVNNMSGSYLQFDGRIEKAWLTTMFFGTENDYDGDILLIKPDGSYEYIQGKTKQTIEIDISQQGWYYLSLLDAPVKPQQSWAITAIYENDDLSMRYMKFIYTNLQQTLVGGTDHDSIEIYYNNNFNLRNQFEIFGVIIGAGAGGWPVAGLTEDKMEVILSDGTYQQLHEDTYNGKKIFEYRTVSDFANGTYNAIRSHNIPGGEVDIFDEVLGKDYFSNKDVVGYKITKIGTNGLDPQLIGLAQEIYSPEIYINTTMSDATPGTIIEGEKIHTILTVSNITEDEQGIAYNSTITSNVDDALSNVSNIVVMLNGKKYDKVKAVYDSAKNTVTLSNLDKIYQNDTITIEYDAVVNSNINKTGGNTRVSLSTNATVKSYPIDISSLSQADKNKYSSLYLFEEDDSSISGTYNKVSEGVEVRYVDQVTGKDIASRENISGLEKDRYDTQAKKVDGYELVVTPSNASGNMTVDKIIVTYEYRKVSKVTAKYIDANTGKQITEDIVKQYKEEDVYTTEEKTFGGYKIVLKPNNAQGKVGREDIEVVYEYKKISAGVEVKYIDQVTGKDIASRENISGLEKDRYDTQAKDVDGYELVVTPSNASGDMKVEKITVIYEYRKVSKVTIVHIDGNTREKIIEDVVKEYKEGDEYIALGQEIPGYTITREPSNNKGIVRRDDIQVIYEYKRISEGLVVKYVDEITNEVMNTEEYEGNENDVIKLEEKSFSGYVLSKRPKEKEIKLTVESQERIFYYKKIIDIDIVGIDANTKEEIYTKVQTGIEGDKYTTVPNDIPGYKVSKVPENNNGTYTREDIRVVYEYQKIAGGVKVSYIDKETGEILKEYRIDGLVGERYETQKEEIEKYNYLGVEGEERGNLGEQEKQVKYYYEKKRGIVEVIYVDEEGNELYKEEMEGKVDDEYKVEQKEIENYIVKERPDNETGKYEEGRIVVKYVMEKIKGIIVVNFVDKDGNSLYDTQRVEQYVEENFYLNAPEIEGYRVVENGEINLKYIEGEQVINVVYEKIEEAPQTGDINIYIYIVGIVISVYVISKILRRKFE